jgi:hypothetical protein
MQRCLENHTTELVGRIGKMGGFFLLKTNTNSFTNRKGKGLPSGEENLGSDPDFVLSFFMNHKQMANAVVDTVEAQDMMQRAARHSTNVVNAMKAYT